MARFILESKAAEPVAPANPANAVPECAREQVSVAPSTPPGYRLVPVEATEEMIDAGYQAVGAMHYSPTAEQGWGTHAKRIWSAMLAASPEADKSGGDKSGGVGDE